MGRVKYNPQTGIVTLENGDEMDFDDWASGFTPAKEGDAKPEETEGDQLREFFFGKKAEPISDISKQWKDEGRCPICGELGRIHLSVMVCSQHGPY